jgi:hypothetical protein
LTRRTEIDLVPAQVADLGRPEPVPKRDQDHSGIAVTVAVGLCGFDQGFDLAGRQVLPGAKLGTTRPTLGGAEAARAVDRPNNRQLGVPGDGG